LARNRRNNKKLRTRIHSQFSDGVLSVSYDWDIDLDRAELDYEYDRPIHASVSITISKDNWSFSGEAFQKESDWEWNNELSGKIDDDFEFTPEYIYDWINDTISELAPDSELLESFENHFNESETMTSKFKKFVESQDLAKTYTAEIPYPRMTVECKFDMDKIREQFGNMPTAQQLYAECKGVARLQAM
jgi:hypothetical protein